VWQAACTAAARAPSVHAITVAAGCSSAISRARLGPDSTATRSAPAPVTSQMTSLIRFVVPSSMPFISDSSVASEGSSGAQPVRFSRSDWDGTARTTMAASSSASAGSAVARTASGSRTPGR
jgi:hypothetical protein